MPMNPAVQAVIKAITRLQPDVANSWNSQRKVEDAAGKLTVADPRCRIDEITATADDGYEIPLRVFTPLDIDFSLKRGLHVNEDHRGTILYLHGGGWANGDVEFYSDACMRTALKLERRVIAVDYRRSPEYRFPTALEDCYATARQLFAGELIRDADPANIVLMGDSAGGNLTAAVSLLARERGEFRPRTQILLYPLVYNDHSETTLFDSVRHNGEDYILTRQAIGRLHRAVPAHARGFPRLPLRTAHRDVAGRYAPHARHHRRVRSAARRGRNVRCSPRCRRQRSGLLPHERRRARLLFVPLRALARARHLPPHRALPRRRPAPETR